MKLDLLRLSEKLTLYEVICKVLQFRHVNDFAYICFLLKPYFRTIVSLAKHETTLRTIIS